MLLMKCSHLIKFPYLIDGNNLTGAFPAEFGRCFKLNELIVGKSASASKWCASIVYM